MFEDGSVPRSVDQQLIRAAASDKRSPRELSAAVGGQLSPERARMRLEELLDDSDYLTYVRERRLLILNMRELLDTTAKDALKGNDSNARRMYLDTLKAIADRLDKTQLNVDAVTDKINTAQARVLADMAWVAIQHLRSELKDRYGTDDDEIDALLAEGLELGQKSVESKVLVVE